MAQLKLGDAAPDFALTDAAGKTVTLASYGPGKVIVYFYPAALTPGCTVQAIDFSAAAPAFAQAGYRIVGISPDDVPRLQQFTAKEHLHLTLLADPDHATCQAYGAWGSRVMWGKEVVGVIRSTFIVDVAADGEATVKEAMYGVRAAGHVEKLRHQLSV
ncbi:MAG: peroxiredoxin [Propionibacteriaceae bacterium]|jgi:peroxiredoxin Q/BCP|nr:peroxiredoxin [Propionibacteriaceae bacterium]